ncbi:MAG: hypothetical protein AAF544_13720, partial [Bacteroidota bacterium]
RALFAGGGKKGCISGVKFLQICMGQKVPTPATCIRNATESLQYSSNTSFPLFSFRKVRTESPRSRNASTCGSPNPQEADSWTKQRARAVNDQNELLSTHKHKQDKSILMYERLLVFGKWN